jgi:hypothetical protein
MIKIFFQETGSTETKDLSSFFLLKHYFAVNKAKSV